MKRKITAFLIMLLLIGNFAHADDGYAMTMGGLGLLGSGIIFVMTPGIADLGSSNNVMLYTVGGIFIAGGLVCFIWGFVDMLATVTDNDNLRLTSLKNPVTDHLVIGITPDNGAYVGLQFKF